MTWRLGLVAGEPSGDLIAARVLAGLKQSDPLVRPEGIGGPQLTAEGLDIWHPMHALSVFGYVDALKRLPSLIHIYRDVKRRWLNKPPALFLGIDAPDFNLRLEHNLRRAGIPTVHFVGPSIWAWRYERIHYIREAVSHMLVLFPFEEAIYKKEGIPVTYVGHPLADAIPMQPDLSAARSRLGLDQTARIVAILPGSRSSEIKLIGPRFLQAAQRLQRKDPKLQFVVPMVNRLREQEFRSILSQYPVANLEIISTKESWATQSISSASDPVAWSVLEACDVALVASGTATLETALFKKPMVISYAVSPLVRKIMAWKSGQARPYLPWVGLPNVLLNDFAVPELIQEDATPENLANEISDLLRDEARCDLIRLRFTEMHHTLRCDTPSRVAHAIESIVHSTVRPGN
ncbi:lipid-A-disaccharide synthase [Zwartia sp.]|uniref:lipid-A-disaccharide synthase n=1 Tax=Zwartia sp. TaxID=2978004 RepID=UPI002722FC31|nr:lipid-A-disaccharide synthase [Zwartia sp.]MDO9024359.1 lipid-A-disaccharide synthase [Zwartia sp.]